MADDIGHSSASHGPAIPPEALQQGSMNQNPNFKLNKGDEPEAKKVNFGTVGDSRVKYVKPGKYPLKEKRMKDVDGKILIVKDMQRTDH